MAARRRPRRRRLRRPGRGRRGGGRRAGCRRPPRGDARVRSGDELDRVRPPSRRRPDGPDPGRRRGEGRRRFDHRRAVHDGVPPRVPEIGEPRLVGLRRPGSCRDRDGDRRDSAVRAGLRRHVRPRHRRRGIGRSDARRRGRRDPRRADGHPHRTARGLDGGRRAAAADDPGRCGRGQPRPRRRERPVGAMDAGSGPGGARDVARAAAGRPGGGRARRLVPGGERARGRDGPRRHGAWLVAVPPA